MVQVCTACFQSIEEELAKNLTFYMNGMAHQKCVDDIIKYNKLEKITKKTITKTKPRVAVNRNMNITDFSIVSIPINPNARVIVPTRRIPIELIDENTTTVIFWLNGDNFVKLNATFDFKINVNHGITPFYGVNDSMRRIVSSGIREYELMITFIYPTTNFITGGEFRNVEQFNIIQHGSEIIAKGCHLKEYRNYSSTHGLRIELNYMCRDFDIYDI